MQSINRFKFNWNGFLMFDTLHSCELFQRYAPAVKFEYDKY